jgi:hypothetical protein
MGHPNERKAVWRMHESEYVPKVIYHTAVKASNNNNNNSNIDDQKSMEASDDE